MMELFFMDISLYGLKTTMMFAAVNYVIIDDYLCNKTAKQTRVEITFGN
jgi:hypothetical protein